MACGPVSGPSSLKHNTCRVPSCSVTDAGLATYPGRSSPSKVWNTKRRDSIKLFMGHYTSDLSDACFHRGVRVGGVSARVPTLTGHLFSIDRPCARRGEFDQMAVGVSKVEAPASQFPRPFLLHCNSSRLEPRLPGGQFGRCDSKRDV